MKTIRQPAYLKGLACCRWIFLSLTLHCGLVQAQPQLKFETLSPQDGLLSPFVFKVVEDKNGFIWIATRTGLQRFDGNEFKNFYHVSDDPSTLSSNMISTLLVDNDNQIWVGTTKGLNIYSQNQEQFQLFDFKVDAKDSLAANKVSALYQSENGMIWIGSNLGLTRYDPKTRQSVQFQHPAISAIKAVNAQTLLVGTMEQGLYTFDRKQQAFSAVKTADGGAITSHVRDILKTSTNTWYVTTVGQGLFTYHPAQHNIKSAALALPDKHVRGIAQESNGLIWVATREGLSIFDSANDKTPDAVQLSTLEESDDAEGRVSDIFVDSNENLWFSTAGYGVFKFSSRSRQFEYYRPNKAGDKGLQNRVVIDFAEAPDGTVYVGKLSGNVSVLNPKNKSFKHLAFLENGKPLARMVTGIAALSNEELLVSIHSDTFRVSTRAETQEVTTTKQHELLKGLSLVTNNQAFLGPYILAYSTSDLILLKMDQQGQLAIEHSFAHGLEKVSRNTRQVFTNYYVTEDHHVYICDDAGGIARISDYHSAKPGYEVIRARDHSYIDSLIIDNKQNLWAAIEGTKLLVMPPQGEPYYYDGFSDDTAGFMSLQYNPTSDQLWLTTNVGLANIDLRSGVLYQYDELDGVEKYLDETGAMLWAQDGSMYIGARNGFNRFDGGLVKPDLAPINVRITDFLLAGKKVKPGASQTADDRSILEKSILDTRSIQLKHHQNAFGFEFTGVLTPFKRNIRYAYQLAGYEDDWTYVDSQKRFANYTNIPPGEYVFKARARNKNNVWSTVNGEVSIIISPPWWQTFPAYFLYFVLIVLLVYGIVKVRTTTLLKRSRLLEVSVRQRTTELAVEKKKVEQLLIKKDQEFANLSHEFRTPLTLILGPVQQLSKKFSETAQLQQLNIIERNGYRLLRMVDQLLNIETFKVDAITHKVSQHFAHSIKTIRLAFIPMAQNKNITIEVGQLDVVCAEFTQDAFEQILLNLLSNAIKYSKDGGKIDIDCVRTKDNQLKLTVSDTGIGISKDQQQAIFSRFHRVHDTNSQHVVGTGIGLALVKSLIEAHQGSIEVDSELGKGTKITLSFPIINEADSQIPADKINDELISKELKSIEQQAVQMAVTNAGEDKENETQTTILVIDDNPDMLNYISTNLSEEHQILSAANGREGLDIAIAQVPDLIVSDVMMPEIDGYQLADALRENNVTAHIPIILLTAKGDANSKLKGLNKQVDEYLTKPFSMEELKVRITNLLEIRKILRKRFAVSLFSSEVPTQDDVQTNDLTEEQKFLASLNDVLEKSYNDMELRIGHLAEGLYLSERQLFRKLKGLVDMTPTEYLRNFRLLKATQLLKQGQKSTIVALEVGFSSASYFTKCFRAQYGQSPSEYVLGQANSGDSLTT